MEAATRVHDSEAAPLALELVEQVRCLPANLLELPVAEGEALVSRHLRPDVAVNRAIQVLWIQVECEFLASKEPALPSMRIVEVSRSRRLERRVDVPVVVDALRQVTQQIGPKLPHVLDIIDHERDILEMAEPTGIDARVASEDQRIHPASLRTGHPSRGRPIVHLRSVEATALPERGRSKVPRQFVLRPYHAGESGLRVKASLVIRGREGIQGESSGFHATWARSSSASRRAMSGDLISKPKTSAFSRIRSGRTDFGITTRPCWRLQRMRICAGVRPCFAAICVMSGCLRRRPRG